MPQTERLCGGAAAAMVLRYWGATDVLAEDFAPLVDQSLGGIPAGRLADALPPGYSAQVASSDAPTMERHLERGRPVIAMLEVAPGRRHYVVVVAWTNDRVLYHDPADRPFRVARAAAFQRAWAATGRLAVLIVPAPETAAAGRARPPEPAAVPERALLAPPVPGAPVLETAPAADRCGGLVTAGVARAADGDLDAASQRLEAAASLCPASGPALRELAGVRFRQERYADAAALAERASERDPRDGLALRLLASSRFLEGDESGALAAWNALGEPELDIVSVEGLDRTRPAVVSRRLGLTPRRLLAPRAFRRAARRLADMPTLGPTRLHYSPLANGRASVTASVVEQPLLAPPLALAVQLGTDALTRRETRLGVASPGHEGGWLEAGARWQEHRPAGWLSLDAPRALGLPGRVRLEIGFDEQAYALAGPTPVVERRRRAALGAGEWLASDLHVSATLALERDRATGSAGVATLRLERRLLSDRLAIVGRSSGGFGFGDAARFGVVDARLALRSTASRTAALRAFARLGASAAGAAAPLSYWPGAGTGIGRDRLLRAHPLLADGVVAGDAFGRRLLDAGVELDAVVVRLGPVPLRLAGFVDAARASARPGGSASGLLVDVGGGLRVEGPWRATLRVDVATAAAAGPGGATVSAGWVLPWPR